MPQREIAIVVYDGVQALDVAGPLDVFAEASRLLPPDDGYRCVLVAENQHPVRASSGIELGVQQSFVQARRVFHTVLVAGGPGLPTQPEQLPLSNWLQQWGCRATRYGSVCTGAFALGHAGLLAGRTVTTHWQHAEQLAACFPDAKVEHDRIYSRDGALVTSAGVTAGIDLALALVSEDHGPALSLACAKRLVVVAQRQGGQSQFSPLLQAPVDPDTPLGKVQAHVMAHLAEPYTVERLADIAGVSLRTMSRLFKHELGITAHDYVAGVRLDRARQLLEASALPLKVVAYECGFTTPEQMRSTFQRKLGVSPLRYRESFNALSMAGNNYRSG